MTLLPLLLLLFPLLSISLSTNTLPPCTIIGGSGRIGSLLSSASPSNTYLISSRTPTPYADLPSGPIYIATRNDVLNTVIENTPPDRLCDLVFLQNGYVEDFLKYKLPGVEYSSITQALLFFAVTVSAFLFVVCCLLLMLMQFIVDAVCCSISLSRLLSLSSYPFLSRN